MNQAFFPIRCRFLRVLAVALALGVSASAAEPAAETRWGPLRAGDEISLREAREAPSLFLIEAGPGRARRAAEFQRAAPVLPPGQAGHRIVRIEVQARETFLVLLPLPLPGLEGEHELWIPVSAIRQVRVWK